jgi:hypothetical protein
MRSVSYRRTAIGIEAANKVGTFCIGVLLIVALAAAGAIPSGELPDGSVQWLPV